MAMAEDRGLRSRTPAPLVILMVGIPLKRAAETARRCARRGCVALILKSSSRARVTPNLSAVIRSPDALRLQLELVARRDVASIQSLAGRMLLEVGAHLIEARVGGSQDLRLRI